MESSKMFKVVTNKTISMTLAASLALAACAPAPLATTVVRGELPTGPLAGDAGASDFYRYDRSDLPAPGSVLRQEKIPLQSDMPHAGEAFRILYVSDDARWNSGRLPVSGALFFPTGKPPADGWPLMSWGHGTVGISDGCAPSFTGIRPRDAAYIDQWLSRGYAVVASDYQGLGGPGPHPYHHWQTEGRSVLDAARAALRIAPERISNRLFLSGQSQGSGAVLGAGMQHAEYAPELNLLAIVASGLTGEFPGGPIKLSPRRSDTIVLQLASGGLRDDSPPIEELVTDEGRELLLAARTGCKDDVKARASELGLSDLSDVLTITPQKLYSYALPLKEMPQRDLGVPIFLATGQADRTTLPHRQFVGARALCAAGNDVTWKVYPGHGHDGALNGSFEDAAAWIDGLKTGAPSQSNCATLADPGAPDERDPSIPFNDD